MMFELLKNKMKSVLVLALLGITCGFITSSHGQTLLELETTMEISAEIDGTQADTLRDTRPQRRPGDRRQFQRGNEAATAGGDIDSRLLDILELVNQVQKPNTQQIAASRQSLKNNKKFLKQFKKEMVCQYYMLTAWLNYFEGDPIKALQAATKAYKTDSKNNDAHITQTATAILADKKPLVLKPKRKRGTSRTDKATDRRNQRPNTRSTGRGDNSRNQGRRNQSRRPKDNRNQERGVQNPRMPMGRFPGGFMGRGSMSSSKVSSGNILDFDVEALNTDMLGEKIRPLQLNCLNGTSFSYTPQKSNICILLWQLEDVKEPNNIGEMRTAPRRSKKPSPTKTANPRDRQMPSMLGLGRGMPPGRMLPGMREGRFPGRNKAVENPFSSQMSAFANLFNSQIGSGQMKFVAVNTNSIYHRQEVIEKVSENPWPWAQVMADDSTAQFADIDVDPQKPMLVIASKDGTIKYAGPAAGFLAAMVINDRLGLASATDFVANKPPPQTTNAMTQAMQQMFQSLTNNTQNNSVQPRLPNSVNNDKYEDLAVDVQAGKLLEHARAYYKIGTRFTTPKTFVELCRRILREYPNTHYAEEARQLLRKLSERHRKRYKVTNEEMGL